MVFWAYHSRCSEGGPTPDCNLSLSVDYQVIPLQHLYRQGSLGHDPEGLVVIVGCLITMLAGVTAGKILLLAAPASVTLPRLAAWGVAVGTLGLVTLWFVDPMKRLWSPSFALLTAVASITLLVLGYVLHDGPAPAWWASRRGRWGEPLVALGRNALLVYFGSHVAIFLVAGAMVRLPAVGAAVNGQAILGIDVRWWFSLAFIASWWVLAWVLHRRRIYIHA